MGFLVVRFSNGLLNGTDLNGAGALVAFLNFELNSIALIEDLEAFARNTGMMYEHIRTVFLREETVTLFLVKPFNCSFRHAACTPCTYLKNAGYTGGTASNINYVYLEKSGKIIG